MNGFREKRPRNYIIFAKRARVQAVWVATFQDRETEVMNGGESNQY